VHAAYNSEGKPTHSNRFDRVDSRSMAFIDSDLAISISKYKYKKFLRLQPKIRNPITAQKISSSYNKAKGWESLGDQPCKTSISTDEGINTL
jgi:hypothetical protein